MEHHFTPTRYHTTLGPHPPVLRVGDGDTLVTTTVDAWGVDHRREQVTPRSNPQTGPFYVEGAEPGDTLAVDLEEIRPNRSYGFCQSAVAANVVDPDYVRQLPQAPLRSGRWTERRGPPPWSARNPGWAAGHSAGAHVGVLRRGGQGRAGISTATSAEHGGNMDYRGFVAGTRVYFPVFEPGAMFFLGDGHAVQGDGEIVGTGIEISMDVRVTLRVLKGKSIGWPRGENDEWIFTVGNARPLDQATQHATTEMLRWLQQDYELDALGANLLLAQCVRYQLGNIFDPAYTMVCKVNKGLLSGR